MTISRRSPRGQALAARVSVNPSARATISWAHKGREGLTERCNECGSAEFVTRVDGWRRCAHLFSHGLNYSNERRYVSGARAPREGPTPEESKATGLKRPAIVSPASMNTATNSGVRALLFIWIQLTGRSPSQEEQIEFLRSKESLKLRRFLHKYGTNWMSSIGRRCLRPSRGDVTLKLGDWLTECRAGLATTALGPSPSDPRPPQRTRQRISWLPATQNYDDDT